MTDFTTPRRYLRLFIAFLALTALVAVVCVLSGDFGDFQLRTLITTATISLVSIDCMACAAFIGRRGRPQLGKAGMGLAVAAGALLVLGVWASVTGEAYWRLTGVAITVAVATAHAFLVLLPDLAPRHRWVQPLTLGSIGVLALQVVAAIVGEIESGGYYQLLAAVAIVVTLETLVLPILARLSRGEDGSALDAADAGRRLELVEVEGEVFRDASGRRYRVVAL